MKNSKTSWRHQVHAVEVDDNPKLKTRHIVLFLIALVSILAFALLMSFVDWRAWIAGVDKRPAAEILDSLAPFSDGEVVYLALLNDQTDRMQRYFNALQTEPDPAIRTLLAQSASGHRNTIEWNLDQYASPPRLMPYNYKWGDLMNRLLSEGEKWAAAYEAGDQIKMEIALSQMSPLVDELDRLAQRSRTLGAPIWEYEMERFLEKGRWDGPWR